MSSNKDLTKKSKKGVNESENDPVEVTHTDKQDKVEEQNSLENETHNEIIDKKILRFQAQVNMFKSKLEKG